MHRCLAPAVLLVLATGLACHFGRAQAQDRASSPGGGQKSLTAEADEKWREQFKAGTRPLGTALATPAPVRGRGKIKYTLHQPKDPPAEEVEIYKGIRAGMDRAAEIYNTHTALKKDINVHFSPGTPTADGNINGTIRLGRNARNARVCMHEICHTLGVGTHHKWRELMVGNRWQGKKANALLQKFTGDPAAQLHGDHMHFWPYGLNYDNEVKSDEDLIRHAQLVEAIVEDLEAAR